MSSPVSIQDGPFTTNTLATEKFLLIHFFIIWASILPSLIELYLFSRIYSLHYTLFYFILPLQICIGYLTIILFAALLSKFLLILIKFIHIPKQGVFNTEKNDKDYYFWSLRAVIKKWPIWITNLIPSSSIHNLILNFYGIKTDNSNIIYSGNIDTEFIELGINIVIGHGTSVKSSIILRGHLYIKKIIIGDNVVIGSNSVIAPGTCIGSNTVLGTMSMTRLNQKLEPNAIYTGDPIEKATKIKYNVVPFSNKIKIRKNSNSFNYHEEKFVNHLRLNIFKFGIVYFLSNLVPILVIVYYSYEYLFPLFFLEPNVFHFFSNIHSILILLITPLLLIFLFLVNLITVIFISKLTYKVIQHRNPPKEGVFHWNVKNKDYHNYFKRSFILRYVKWKIQKSPFPWLLRSAFNFIGNCQFGKKTVIEDSFIAKEFLRVGKNSYLGKVLIANHLWDRNLTIKGITIGDNVEISDNCCVAPGTEIEDGVTLLPLSITSKCEKLASNSIFFHSTITNISEGDPTNILNEKLGDNYGE